MASLIFSESAVRASGMKCAVADRDCCADKCMAWRRQTVMEIDLAAENPSATKRTVPTGSGWCLMVPSIEYDK